MGRYSRRDFLKAVGLVVITPLTFVGSNHDKSGQLGLTGIGLGRKGDNFLAVMSFVKGRMNCITAGPCRVGDLMEVVSVVREGIQVVRPVVWSV